MNDARQDGGTADIREREWRELQATAHALGERVKELNCLYAISKLVDQREAALGDILRRTVDIVAAAWQYPDIACARIRYAGVEYRTASFAESAWSQGAPILVYGSIVGELEVRYLEERPELAEGPFLHEERSLLNAVAQRLGEIAERKRAEEQLLTHQMRLRSLATELLRAEERERRTISRDLHDGIGQTLATANLRLRLLAEQFPAPPVAETIDDVCGMLERAIEETRTLMFEISPPVLWELGLEAALEWLVEQIRARGQLDVTVRWSGAEVTIGDDLRQAVFRAVRELLRNAVRHAKAHAAHVTVARGRRALRVEVRDDGHGFDVAEARERALRGGNFGLFNVAERIEHLGGSMAIDSAPGRGTTVTLEVPLPRTATPRRKR